MGQYSITAGTFGKALAATPVAIANLDARSAWEFENQSGTFGNNYTGSQLYVGGAGNVDVILAGVTGAQDTVTSLNQQAIFTGANPSYTGFVAGTGYVTGANLLTTVVTTVPNSPATVPTGLTVDINVIVPTTNAKVPGTGYTTGPYEVTGGTAGASGLSGTITSITAGGGIDEFTITDGGQGYSEGDVLTIIKAGSDDNGTITLLTAPNGAVTADIAIGNNAGTGYSVGDIITVVQTGSGGDCKFVIGSVKSLLPGVNDVVRFTAVPVGTILPAAVSYVINSGTATALVALK